MGRDLRVLVIGCTPLARHAATVVEEVATLVGVVNLHPRVGAAKSRYDAMGEFQTRRPDDLHWTEDINGVETRNWMTARQPDVILQCGWSQIFTADVLRIPRLFCLGIHPSPLPKGRGAAILNWKILEGGGAWGNSLFVMEEKTDKGDLLDAEPFEIEPRDDIRTAYQKVDRTAVAMLRRTLPAIASGTHARTPQDPALATRYYKRTRADGRMEFAWPAEKISRFVRALTDPYPGAFFDTPHGALTVWEMEPGPAKFQETPGRILEIVTGRGVLIQTGEHTSVWLTRITAPHDLEGWADEWATEKNLKVGETLGG